MQACSVGNSSHPTFLRCSFIQPGTMQEIVPLHRAAATHFTAAATAPPRRPDAYKPGTWDDGFIQSLSSKCMEDDQRERMEKLKQDVRELLGDRTLGLAKQLELVDIVQDLGVGRYFDKEVHNILLVASTAAGNSREVLKDDLASTALLFRLLRQHGYRVTEDVFNSFRGAISNFKTCLHTDIRGALNLYEAVHHAHEVESTLCTLKAVASEQLEKLADEDNDRNLKEEVLQRLQLPINRRIDRLHARWLLDMYALTPGMIDPSLHELAVLEFNMVQYIHRGELKRMSRWWMDLGLNKKLSFARDRITENFFCSIGCIPNVKFSLCREKLTQVCCFISTIDDIYDEYGTYEELELLTNAMERWDVTATDQLPQYMKACYLALLHAVDQMSLELQREKGLDVLSYLKKTWADLCRSFFIEAKWHHDKYMPTFEQYMDNAWMSISVHVVLAHAVLFMGLDISNKDLEHLQTYPNLIRYSAIIFRLCNDLVEREAGNVPSSIACYMKGNNSTEQVARRHIRKLIDETWCRMNDELVASSLPAAFTATAANVARTGHCLYQHGDGHSNPGQEFKKRVSSLLFEPIIQLKRAAAS